MKKVITIALTFSALGAPLFSNASSKVDLAALDTQIQKLQAEQKGDKTQFANALKEIKKVEKQLPELNKSIQSQLKKIDAANTKMIKELETSIGEQITQLNTQLNDLKKSAAEKGVS